MGGKPASITALRLQDPLGLGSAIRGAVLRPVQLDRHPQPCRLVRMPTGAACLDFAFLGPAMQFSGAMPAGCYTLVFVLACPQPGHSFNFEVEHGCGYLGFFPPGGLLDAVTPAGYANATLTVPVAEFEAALATHFPGIPRRVLARGAGMRVGPSAQADLRRLLQEVEAAAWDAERPLESGLVRRRLERDLLAAFVAALRSGCDLLVPPQPVRVAARHRRLRQAQDFIATHSRQPIYLEDLCGATGLSVRGLENLFRDFFGLGPMAYLRHQRLHGVRRALREETPAPGVVKRLALEWGFPHLGRFARDYRALFGEPPRKTPAGR